MNKISAYLGFCIRAGKIAFGVDRVETQKRAYLLIADGALSDNSKKVMVKARERLRCPLLITENGLLGELTKRPNVKAVAVTEEQLAKAIVNESQGKSQLKLYSGGQN